MISIYQVFKKLSLKHWLGIRDESVWEDGGNVDPCGEDGFTKGLHGVEMMSLNSLAITPNTQWDSVHWNTQHMSNRAKVLILEDALILPAPTPSHGQPSFSAPVNRLKLWCGNVSV